MKAINNGYKKLEWAILHFAYGNSIRRICKITKMSESSLGKVLSEILYDKYIMRKIAEIRRGLYLQKRGNFATKEIMAW